LTLTVTTSGAASGVTFADDVDANGNAGDTIVINVTNDDVTFQGNIQSTVGTTAADINLGSGGADPTLTMTVDTVNTENLTIEATIDAVDAGDTVTLAIANTDSGNANTVTFTGAIGGAQAIDTLAIGKNTTTVFEGTVDADTITNRSTTTTTFEDTVTGDLVLSSSGTIVLTDGASIVGTVDVANSSSNLGTLEIQSQTGATTAVSGAIGATNSITAINIDATGDDITFGSTVAALDIEITGGTDADIVNFAGNVTGDIEIVTAGKVFFDPDVTLTGTIVTDTDGAGIAEWDTPTASSTLASGAVGSTGLALAQVIVNSDTGFTSTFGSTVEADTVTINGTGTVAFTDDVTASTAVDFIGAATATVAANKKIVGNVDASGGSVGTLTFAQTTVDTILVSGTVGGSNAITALNVDVATGITATLADAVDATTIILSGAGTLQLDGITTGDVDIFEGGTVSVAATFKIIGNVDNSSGTDGAGTLSVGAIGGALTVVSGDVGANNTLAQITVDTTGGAATFGGDVSATAFDATGGGSTIITGAGTFTTLTTDGDFTSGTGNLEVGGTIALTGGDLFIGAGGATLGGASITAGTIDLAGGDVDFDGDAAQTVTALIDDLGDITVSNTEEVTFESAIGSVSIIDALIVGSGASATFNSTVVAESIDLDGTIKIEDTVDLTTGGGTGIIDIATNATIELGSGIVDGDTAFVVNSVTTTGGTINIVLSTDLVDGDTITLFDSGADVDKTGMTVTDNAFFTFVIDDTGNDIAIDVTARTTDETADDLGVSTQDAIAVTEANAAIIADGDATVFANFNAAINAGGSDATKAAETVAIQADTLGAGTNVAVSTGGQVIGISSDRLGSLRTGNQFENSAGTGFATGGTSAKYGAWVKPFGNWAEQDNTSGVAGFEALTYGMAFGADTALDDQYRGGVSFAYASSDVEGSGAGQSKADIDSYQLTLYGDFTGKNYYAEASLGYAYNNNTVSRVIDFMGTDTTASGEYGSSQFIASFNTGIPMQMAGTAYFTPTAGLAWTHVISEEYTETGAGGLNQTVDIDDIDVLLGTLGAKMHTQIRYNKGYLVPNIHGGVSYDFIGDNTTATASFTGGGAAFTVAGAEVEQFGGNLGFGFTYESKNFWSIGAGYDADMKSGFISHSALFEARFKF